MSEFISFFPPEPGAGPDTRQSRFENNPIARDRFPDGEIEFTFKDFLDTINPLQQIPIVSWIYRAITGETINLAPRLIGAAIMGGPIGILLAGVQSCIEDMTGVAKSGGPVMAALRDLFGGADDGKEPAVPPPAAAVGVAVPPAATLDAISPAANAVAPLSDLRQAPPIAPRATPVSLPRGWSAALPISRGALVAQTAFGRDSGSLFTDTPSQRAERRAPAAVDPGAAAPDSAAPDWVASAMMRALDKYESARRLSGADRPSVSTVE